MLLSFHDNFIARTLAQFVKSFDSAAILDREGNIYALHYETLADLGTLGTAASTVLKYFPMPKNDVVIVNDPYSGGTVLSTLSLVTALNENLFLIARKGFRPRLILAQKLDEEGLRIPPTPLVQNGQIHVPILEAMSEHPQAPEFFKERTEEFCHFILRKAREFEVLTEREGAFFKLPRLLKHLEATRQRVLEIISELPHGEAEAETELLSGEGLKVKLELHSQGLKVDFSGTKSSKTLCLTDSATFGAVLGAWIASFETGIPVNSGLISLLQVASPMGSFLNAKYPSPTFLGFTEGTSFVAQTVLRAIKKLSPQKEIAESAGLPLLLQIDFGNGKRFFESLPGGGGATGFRDGEDAVHFWVRNRLEPSVEEIERRFPLLIKQFGLRKGSGGKGIHKGGNGMTKEYELMSKATLAFIKTQEKHARRGAKGAQDGDPEELFLINTQGEKTILTHHHGQIELNIGDRIYASSAGGGGHGKP